MGVDKVENLLKKKIRFVLANLVVPIKVSNYISYTSSKKYKVIVSFLKKGLLLIIKLLILGYLY